MIWSVDKLCDVFTQCSKYLDVKNGVFIMFMPIYTDGRDWIIGEGLSTDCKSKSSIILKLVLGHLPISIFDKIVADALITSTMLYCQCM